MSSFQTKAVYVFIGCSIVPVILFCVVWQTVFPIPSGYFSDSKGGLFFAAAAYPSGALLPSFLDSDGATYMVLHDWKNDGEPVYLKYPKHVYRVELVHGGEKKALAMLDTARMYVAEKERGKNAVWHFAPPGIFLAMSPDEDSIFFMKSEDTTTTIIMTDLFGQVLDTEHVSANAHLHPPAFLNNGKMLVFAVFSDRSTVNVYVWDIARHQLTLLQDPAVELLSSGYRLYADVQGEKLYAQSPNDQTILQEIALPSYITDEQSAP